MIRGSLKSFLKIHANPQAKYSAEILSKYFGLYLDLILEILNIMTLRSFRFLLLFSLLLCSNILHAKPISIQVSEKIIASADYLTGEPGKPILIFIHGFLQTRDFSTVNRLSEALNDSGFPVLSPTLSLGISSRKKALACESIHLHSLSNDTDEIEKWVNWASQQGYKEIVLVGHSAGSVNITAYLARRIHRDVSKTILISLSHYGPNRSAAFETEKHATTARNMLKNSDAGLHKFALAFCKQYLSPAADFLSYYDWSGEKILRAINTGFSKNFIIIGSKDERIGEQWINALKRARAKVITIDGANHFFDQSHEFDLLDQVENILTTN